MAQVIVRIPYGWIKGADYRALSYMIANLGSKAIAAIAQLYAIFIFTKMHTQDEAALIFILLGYAIWFQAFELGLAQTLQNRFNVKMVSADDMLIMIVAHYLCMFVIAAFVVATPCLADALLPPNKDPADVTAFSLGAAILLIASNNVISQRLLLVFNKGQFANSLIMLQSTLAVVGLVGYQYIGHPNLVAAVSLYLGPQVLVFLPLVLGWVFKLLRNGSRIESGKFHAIVRDSLGFWGLGVLAAIFLGSDYYFAAHYMSSEQVVSYHLATRIFFISFVAYFAYVQHGAKRLSARSLSDPSGVVPPILKNSIAIGFAMVLAVYGISAILDWLGVFSGMTNGRGIGQGMLVSALLYFMIRVCRDVSLVVVGGLNAKSIIYKVYTLEVLVGLSLMYWVVPKFGGQGLFASLTIACSLGMGLLVQQVKSAGIFFVYRDRNDAPRG